MEAFILSMTWQMAALYPEVRKRIIRICTRDKDIMKSADHRTFHRKFWQQGIFEISLERKTFWVLDAFDECRAGPDLAKFLSRVREKTRGQVRIMITTRNSHSGYPLSPSSVATCDILLDDVQRDIARFLRSKHDEIPGADANERDLLSARILDKSNGCFLWAALARLRILDELPPGMYQLYARILKSMSTQDKVISKSILIWVTCAVRPLQSAELKYILENVVENFKVDDIDKLVSDCCHDLVYLDKKGNLKMRHTSARDFLLRRDINSDIDPSLTIEEQDGQKALSMACLAYLNGPEISPKGKKRLTAARAERSAFESYACYALHEHINRSSALDLDILQSLAAFLQTNVLFWIERLAAKAEGLEVVLQLALFFTESHGLIFFSAKKSLLLTPVYSKFGYGPGTAIAVIGLSAKTWDDCMGTVIVSDTRATASGSIPQERLLSLATSSKAFCIGTSKGRIVIFNAKTCLEERALEHGAFVVSVQFAATQPLLATVSNAEVRVWNTETWEEQWKLPVPRGCLDISFVDDDRMILIAFKNNSLVALNLIDRSFTTTNWIESLDDPHRGWYYGIVPEFASINPQLGLLAIAYRYQNVLIYNYDEDSYVSLDHKEGLAEVNTNAASSIMVYSMVFSTLPGTSLLAIGYNNSTLVLHDTEQGAAKITVPDVLFYRLKSSPDGRTLAAARMDGAIIELYDFETLRRLIVSALMVRFLRSNSAQIAIDCCSSEPVDAIVESGNQQRCSGSEEGELQSPEEPISVIGAIACDSTGASFFVGKYDGTVSVYDSKSGLLVDILFSHKVSIKSLHFGASEVTELLISVDTAGILSVHKMQRRRQKWVTQRVFDYRAVTGIQQYLCRTDLKSLLISSNGYVSIRDLLDGKVDAGPVAYHEDTEKSHRWTEHPKNSSLLLCLTSTSARIYDWSTLQQVGQSSGKIALKSLSIPQLSELQVQNVLPIFSTTNHVLLSMMCEVLGRRGTRIMTCFPGDVFEGQSNPVSTLLESQPICDMIQVVVGTYRGRLVFLHRDGWICSVKGATLWGEGTDGVSHHFPPPVDWLRTTFEVLIRVSKLGDVLFVVNGEVAVVKRGLNKSMRISQSTE
ncbi:hypothetical protein BJ170DRAFT_715282 [Xylariales sp. AK1849]|nr:hypothetical protein BJ170DRAFT_715282 [Xylariales sp. AK1849]